MRKLHQTKQPREFMPNRLLYADRDWKLIILNAFKFWLPENIVNQFYQRLEKQEIILLELTEEINRQRINYV